METGALVARIGGGMLQMGSRTVGNEVLALALAFARMVGEWLVDGHEWVGGW